MLTYNAKLESSDENLSALKEILEWQMIAYNNASEIQFCQEKSSIKDLHSKFYYPFREKYPYIPSQVAIRGEQECLSGYRSVKSNKHKIKSPIVKKNLSMRLDKRLYTIVDKDHIRVTTSKGRQEFQIKLYGKLSELLDKYPYQDPLIFERNGDFFVGLTFKIEPKELKKQKSALGVDLGMRASAACSDGRLIIDKEFNKQKRRLRFLKRQLQSKGTKSARKKLKKIRHKEHNKNKNQSHKIANEILKTPADTIVLEDLTQIKKKKHKNQNKNAISQVPFYQLRQIISYKARNQGKTCIAVPPYYTSQDDSITGKRDGIRKGRRYYAKSGLIYDSDINAACNIGQKSKLPLSPPVCENWLLDGAGSVVNLPNVCKSMVRPHCITSPEALARGS